MKIIKRTRSNAAAKLLKGRTANGHEYYYSRKPSARKSDFVVSKAKVASPLKEASGTSPKRK